MKHKTPIEQRIRGWIPKDPILISFQAKSRALVLFMIAVLGLLVVPLFFLTLEARTFLGEGFVILVIVVSVILGYITRKKGWYKPLPKVRRIHIIVCSGLFTAFAIGTSLRIIIGTLPSYYWIPFILLIVAGAFIGNIIWKTLQKQNSGWNSR